jgi:hypothetical protein
MPIATTVAEPCDPSAVRRCFRTRVLDARSSLAAGERPAVAETMQPPIETAVDSATGSNPATRSTTAERWSNYRRRRPVEPWPARQRGRLTAQPLPGRPRRGRARLRPGRAAGLHQRRRGSAGHHLAVAAQAFTVTGLAYRLATPTPSGSGHPRRQQAPPAVIRGSHRPGDYGAGRAARSPRRPSPH